MRSLAILGNPFGEVWKTVMKPGLILTNPMSSASCVTSKIFTSFSTKTIRFALFIQWTVTGARSGLERVTECYPSTLRRKAKKSLSLTIRSRRRLESQYPGGDNFQGHTPTYGRKSPSRAHADDGRVDGMSGA